MGHWSELRGRPSVARALESRPATALRWASNHRGQRRLIGRRYLFDAIARFSPSIAVDAGGIRVHLSTGDKRVSREIFAGGLYQEERLFARLHACLERHGHPATIAGRGFLDVGANIGTATCLALRRYGAARAWTFEPAPENVRLLRQNLLANELQDRVDVHACAVSDQDATVTLELSEDNSGDHRVRIDGNALPGELDEHRRRVVDVPSIRLDGLFEAGAIDVAGIGLAWLDVQGHEAHVLAGAAALLHAPIPIVCEYWPYGLRRSGGLDRFARLVADARRSVVDLGADGEEAITPKDLPGVAGRLPGAAFTDLLLLPPDGDAS